MMPKRNDLVLNDVAKAQLMEVIRVIKGKNDPVTESEAVQYLQDVSGLKNGTLWRIISGESVLRKSLIGIQEALDRVIQTNNAPTDIHFFDALLGSVESVLLQTQPVQGMFPLPSVLSEELVESRVIHLMQSCSQEGIIAIHRRTEEFQSRVVSVVKQAKSFIYTMGRTHRNMLVQDGGQEGWVMDTLIDKMRSSNKLRIRLLLADGFTPDSGYRNELKVHFFPATAESHRHANRDTVIGIGNEIGTKASSSDFRMRILRTAPAYAVLMTESTLFIEQYLPSMTGGATFVWEIRSHPPRNKEKDRSFRQSLYGNVLQDFINQYNEAALPVNILSTFFKRKFSDERPQFSDSDRNERYASAKKVFSIWAQTDPSLPKSPEDHFYP